MTMYGCEIVRWASYRVVGVELWKCTWTWPIWRQAASMAPAGSKVIFVSVKNYLRPLLDLIEK